jgi:hypothetical protein
MTLVRRLSLKISDAVVSYASPGCKEWAEGLSREAAFIKSDWSALRWALGSTRVLLDRREAPVRSLADVSDVARKYVATKLSQPGAGVWCLLPGFQALTYLLKFFDARSGLERGGCGLAVVASISLGICILIQGHRLNTLLNEENVDDTLFYKAALERVRDLPRSSRGWIPFAAFSFYFVGMILAQRGGVIANPVFSTIIVLTYLAVLLVILYSLRHNRRRLEQLESLLAERY